MIDAYHSVALQVLAKAGKARIVPGFTLVLNCDYAQLSPVNGVLHTYQVATQETTYGEQVSLRVRVPEENREEFFKALSSLAGVSWTETGKNNPRSGRGLTPGRQRKVVKTPTLFALLRLSSCLLDLLNQCRNHFQHIADDPVIRHLENGGFRVC